MPGIVMNFSKENGHCRRKSSNRGQPVMARNKSAIRNAGSRSQCCSPVRVFRSWTLVVNLALPAIRGDLGSTSSEVQFVISASAATYAVFVIAGGRLGDLFGRQRMFLWGVAGFTIAALLCGVAWSPGNPGRRANPSRVCGDDVGAAGARLDPRALSTR
jgi:hypothetical protein